MKNERRQKRFPFFHLFFKKKQETAFFFIFAEKTQLIAS